MRRAGSLSSGCLLHKQHLQPPKSLPESKKCLLRTQPGGFLLYLKLSFSIGESTFKQLERCSDYEHPGGL
jgi:hypothetical protein